MAKTSHRLNVLAALFLPMTALTGLLGMSVRADIADTPLNFWMIGVAGVVIGIVLSRVIVVRR